MRSMLLVAAAALCLSLNPVQAQQLAQGAGARAAAPKAPQGQPPAGPQAGPGAPNPDAQIGDMQKRLKITAAQQPQFDALTAVMRQNAQAATASAPQSPPSHPPTAVESIQAMQRAAQSEAESLNKMLPPLQALYDALSPEQKKTADQVFGEQDNEPPPQPAPKRR